MSGLSFNYERFAIFKKSLAGKILILSESLFRFRFHLFGDEMFDIGVFASVIIASLNVYDCLMGETPMERDAAWRDILERFFRDIGVFRETGVHAVDATEFAIDYRVFTLF